MSRLYEESHRALQEEFGTRGLADGVEQAALRTSVGDDDAEFLHSRDMFFLTTVNGSGQPTVSYKGGDPGFVKVVNPNTLVFPSYDGNGMFLSMGNIAANPEIGMLFIDFERPNRRRLQGRAVLERNHPLKAAYPEADFLVQVSVSAMWVNCPRYVHRYEKVESSAYVPRNDIDTPIAPWKRIDVAQPLLTATDQARARVAGLISAEDYEESQRIPR